MAVTATIAPQTFDANVKTALLQFIQTYFDGAAHTIGAQSITFPSVDVRFGQQRIGRDMTKPVVVMSFTGGHAGKRASDPSDIVLSVYAIDNGGPNSTTTKHQVSALLRLVFTGCAAELAKAKLRVRKVTGAVDIPDSDNQYNVTQRMVTLRWYGEARP